MKYKEFLNRYNPEVAEVVIKYLEDHGVTEDEVKWVLRRTFGSTTITLYLDDKYSNLPKQSLSDDLGVRVDGDQLLGTYLIIDAGNYEELDTLVGFDSLIPNDAMDVIADVACTYRDIPFSIIINPYQDTIQVTYEIRVAKSKSIPELEEYAEKELSKYEGRIRVEVSHLPDCYFN